MSTSSFTKRLEALEQKISFRRARQIVILVDGNNEDQSGADAIVQKLDVTDDDLVVVVRKFADAAGLPRIHSVDLT